MASTKKIVSKVSNRRLKMFGCLSLVLATVFAHQAVLLGVLAISTVGTLRYAFSK